MVARCARPRMCVATGNLWSAGDAYGEDRASVALALE